jgi:hypothetical protein
MRMIARLLVFVFVLGVPFTVKGEGGFLMREEFSVTNERPVKVRTSFATEKGKVYRIEASGVVSDWGDKEDGVDAVWCYAEWRCGKKGEMWQQLRINGRGMSEIKGSAIPYNGNHEYWVDLKGDGKPIEFYMSNAQGSWQDNHGQIGVSVFEHIKAQPEGQGSRDRRIREGEDAEKYRKVPPPPSRPEIPIPTGPGKGRPSGGQTN